MPGLFSGVAGRSDSPYINRFLQPDTIVPGYANPQNLNRYSYVNNNPVRYADPSGHRPCEEYQGTCLSEAQMTSIWNNTTDNGNNSDDDNEDDNSQANGGISLNFDTRDIISNLCNYGNCQVAVTTFGMLGTAADGASFIINGMWALAADITLLTTFLGIPGPIGYGAVVGSYALVGAPLSTVYGFMGLGFWGIQGFLTGETYVSVALTLDSELRLKRASGSFSIAQDTAFSALNDSLSLSIKEPNVATLWSGSGFLYDVTRNPLAPYFSSLPPAFPTVVQPNGSAAYDWQTGSFSGDFSFFPPP